MIDLIIFKHLLDRIAEADANGDYAIQYLLVLEALVRARSLGFAGGMAWDDQNPEAVANNCRIVVYIELPTGQVSWHMPEYQTPWDGHTTAQKYARINDFLERQ